MPKLAGKCLMTGCYHKPCVYTYTCTICNCSTASFYRKLAIYRMAQNFDGKILTNSLRFVILPFKDFFSNRGLHVRLIQFVKILLVKFFLAITSNSSKISTIKILCYMESNNYNLQFCIGCYFWLPPVSYTDTTKFCTLNF